jgi:hypothetical protein
MAHFQLPRHSFAKNARENRSFLIQSAGLSIRGAGTAPVLLPASRQVLGVHVADVLDLPIVQQPKGEDGYVSSRDGQITQFRLPSNYGNVGLLAHNDLSGRLFCHLARGQEVQLLYGNHRVETFVITDILRYQALQPENPCSCFRDLQTEETLTAPQLFEKIYMGRRHVTFQTCIAGQDRLSWGRLFVIATCKEPSASHRWN